MRFIRFVPLTKTFQFKMSHRVERPTKAPRPRDVREREREMECDQMAGDSDESTMFGDLMEQPKFSLRRLCQ